MCVCVCGVCWRQGLGTLCGECIAHSYVGDKDGRIVCVCVCVCVCVSTLPCKHHDNQSHSTIMVTLQCNNEVCVVCL